MINIVQLLHNIQNGLLNQNYCHANTSNSSRIGLLGCMRYGSRLLTDGEADGNAGSPQVIIQYFPSSWFNKTKFKMMMDRCQINNYQVMDHKRTRSINLIIKALSQSPEKGGMQIK